MGQDRARLLFRIAGCIDDVDHPRAQRTADRLRACCRAPVAVAGSDGSLACSLGRCKHRLCPLCGGLRARAAAARMEAAIATMDAPRFLTLTIRSAGEDLEELVKTLRESFRRLRQRRAWKEHVVGGIYALEVTYRPDGGGWHPHVHCVIDGKFWRHADLRAEWTQVTGGSSVVDIRAIRSKRGAARYVAKYVAKGNEAAKWPDHAVSEYDATMRGARLLHTFGSLHGVALDVDEPERRSIPDPEPLGLGRLAALGSRGSRRCRRLLGRLRGLGGVWQRAVGTGWDLADRRGPAAPEAKRRRERRLAALARGIAHRDRAGRAIDRRQWRSVEVIAECQLDLPGWLDPPPIRPPG